MRSRIIAPARCVAVVLVVLVTVVGVGRSADAAPTSAIDEWDVVSIDLAARAIAYDSSRDLLLVAVAPSYPALGNHLVELDPQTGAIGRSVVVGADPSAVAVADDGSRAYVGLMGSSAVVEVDLASFTVTRRIWLGTDGSSGARYAEDIAVAPGDPGLVAVSMRNKGLSPRHEGVAVIDEGVMRPRTTPDHTGANRIEWSDDASTLYGYNNETTGFGFYVLTVAPDGVSLTSPGKRFSGFSLDIEYGGGEVVATNGQVVDTSDLSLSGAYTAGGAVALDTDAGTAYFLDGTTLTSHAIDTKLQTGSRTVPQITPTELVDAGSVLAARGAGGLLLMGEGVSGSGFVAPSAPEQRVQLWGERSLELSVEEIVPSPDGSRLYGVVRQSASEHPGTVVEIDTATATVVRDLFVGADPHRLGISDDGSTLLVGHYSATQLTEVSIDDWEIRRTIPIDHYANDIAARPGTSSTFAVVLVNNCCSPALAGQILVEDGQVLPNKGPGHTGATTIAFAGDPTRLYGHNGGTTDYGFYTLEVGDDGLRSLSSVRRLMLGFGLELVGSGGLVYASNGDVVEPTVPALLGSVGTAGQPVPVPAEDRLLMVSGRTIHEFDLDTFGAVGSQQFTSPGGAIDAVLAGDQVAIATNGGRVVFVPVGEDRRQPPTVASLAPSDAPTTGGGLLTIGGSSFTYATGVTIDGAPVPFSIVDDTTITATIPPHAGGDVVVAVTNPKGTSSGGPLFSYIAPQPAVTAVSPPGGPSAGDSAVVIGGAGLSFATEVEFGGAQADFVVVSDTEIRATAPPHAAGVVDVIVTTAGGSSAPSPASRYTYNSASPVVTSVSPNTGTSAGGAEVEIRGSDLLGVDRVQFGDRDAASFEVLSDSRIRAVTPQHAPGIVAVRATNSNGTSPDGPLLARYAFQGAAPHVTSLMPSAGPRDGGNLVYVLGRDFTGATAVRFGAAPATFVVLGDSMLLAVAPPGAVGEVELSVTSPEGTSSGGDAGYEYGEPPVVSGLSATAGSGAGGEVVTIAGSGFTGTRTVEFGPGGVAPLFTVVSDTRIDVLTPTHDPGEVGVLVTNRFGTSSPSSTFRFDAGSGGSPGLEASTPIRVLDSRRGLGGPSTPWGPGETRSVVVAGAGEVPPDATAVVLNLTAVAPSSDTHVTVWPAGAPRPGASNLNVPAGDTRANLVIAGVGVDGAVDIRNQSGLAHLVVDVVAWYGADGDRYNPVTPTRLLDSRTATGPLAGRWGAGDTRTLDVAGRGGVPDGATAAVVNLTAVAPTEDTHLTLWPSGRPRPNASTLNLPAGDTRPNLAVVQLGDDGAVQIRNQSGGVHVVVDLVGFVAPTGADLLPLNPIRVLDTRSGVGSPAVAFGSTESRPLTVAGVAGLPSSATAVALNVTAVMPTAATHVTVWDGVGPRPNASNLNVPAGDTRANLVIAPVAPDGTVRLYNQSGATHLVADLIGVYIE